jgi:prepilin-type N-terminal cleavage/methylation domain-containing protein
MTIVRNRSGTTLTELLVVMVVMGVVGAAMTGLMVSQSRFFNDQEGQANARRVARTGTTLLLSDLRAIETSSGIVTATPTSFEVRVPYRVGVVCGTSGGGNLIATMQPVDSMIVASVTPTGWFWVDSIGGIHYRLGASSPSAGGAASVCTGNAITPIPNGDVVSFPGSPPAGANPGSTITLYQRVQYFWGNSTSVPGTRGLFRRIQSAAMSEEMVAPFDTTAAFRYHMNDGSIVSSPGTMADIRGIEFALTGLNERNVTRGRTQRAPLLTSVFFENR